MPYAEMRAERRHRARERPVVIGGGAVLAAVAGYINVVVLGVFHVPVSHMSGAGSRLSMDLAAGDLSDLRLILSILAGFVLGAVASGAIIGGQTLIPGRRYGVALLFEGLLLALATGLLLGGVSWGVTLAAMACGVQNAMASSYYGMVIRTTHITGVVTDIGVMIGHWLRHRRIRAWKLTLLLAILVGFVVGGVAGAGAYARLGIAALAFASAACLLGGTAYYLWRHSRSRSAVAMLALCLLLPDVLDPAPAAAQASAVARDEALTAELQRLTRGFRGEVGIFVRHLPTGATAELQPDELFPTASLIKIPILLTLYDQVDRGLLDLDAVLPYPDTLRYPYEESTDVVGHLEPGDSLPLRELAFLMLSVSDNVASLWIQALLGGGAAVNRWLEDQGYEGTRVNSRTPGREDARAEFGWGQTTPREIAEMMVSIREGRAVSEPASEEMYRLLSRTYWDRQAVSQIPPTVQAASKQGFVSRSRSEVLLVNAPDGDYVLSVITKGQEDTDDGGENEGYRLIRAISRAVYEHFNRADPWRPLPR